MVRRRLVFHGLLPWIGMLLGVGMLIGVLSVFHLKWNLSASMPIGWYQKRIGYSIERGDLVAVCLPYPIATAGENRGYLFPGHCSGGVTPLLKQVIAVPQDTVRLSKTQMCVNGHCYYAPSQSVDHNGMPPVTTVSKGSFSRIKTYWLYGWNDVLHSWDSRYFGGVSRSAIQGVYRPLWTIPAIVQPLPHVRLSLRHSMTGAKTEVTREARSKKQVQQTVSNDLNGKKIAEGEPVPNGSPRI